MSWLRDTLDRLDELLEPLVSGFNARAARAAVRPRLEALVDEFLGVLASGRSAGAAYAVAHPGLEGLEERLALSSWIGYANHGSTDWNNPANWDDGKIPFKPGSGSNVALFDTSSQTITCPYNTGGSLIENANCGVNIVLISGGLTLTAGLDWEGEGTILTAPGEDLVLQGMGTWTNGDIGVSFGSSGSGGNFIINNNGKLTCMSVGGSSPTCNSNMFVGTTADGVTATAGTVTLQNVTLNTSADFKLQVGNSKSTFNQAVFNMQDASGVGSSKINVSVPQGGTNTAFLDVYGNFNCNSAATRGLVFQNVNAPMKVETTGTLDVKYYNNLQLTANGQSNFALQCQGTTNVGLVNPGGANIGSAGVTCNGKGSNFDTAGSRLYFFGLSDTWSDTGGTGTLELAIAGTLALWSPGTTFQQTSVDINDGDLRFSDNSLFKVQGQYSVTGLPAPCDTLWLLGSKNNVWIGNNVTVSPNAFGTPSATTWQSVISVNGGGQITGAFAKVDEDKWTASNLGTPPWRMQLQFVP